MQYIQIEMTVRIPIYDLSNYDATTADQAARNQQAWYEEGQCSLGEIIDGPAEIVSMVWSGKEL